MCGGALVVVMVVVVVLLSPALSPRRGSALVEVVRGHVGAGGGGANAAASHNGPQSYEGPPLFLRWHTARPVLDVFCRTHPWESGEWSGGE